MSNNTQEISEPTGSQKKKKFNIVDVKPGYSPIERQASNWLTEPLLRSTYQGDETSHRFYLTPTARKQIFKHIGWGKRTRSNHIEQGGILLGHTYVDSEKQLTYGVVEQAIAGKTSGSAAYVEFSHEIWKDMLGQADNLLKQHPDSKLQIIGWYHTHPNELPVFMSGTDQNTQARLFNKDWHFAIVLNPHKQIWKAFWGQRATECEGRMIIKENEVSNCAEKNLIGNCSRSITPERLVPQTETATHADNSKSTDSSKNHRLSMAYQSTGYLLIFAAGALTGVFANSMLNNRSGGLSAPQKDKLITQTSQNAPLTQQIETNSKKQLEELPSTKIVEQSNKIKQIKPDETIDNIKVPEKIIQESVTRKRMENSIMSKNTAIEIPANNGGQGKPLQKN